MQKERKWSDDDMKAMAEVVINKRKTDGLTHLVHLINAAQKEVIPIERHKIIRGLGHCVPLIVQLKKTLPELSSWEKPIRPSSRLPESPTPPYRRPQTSTAGCDQR